MKKNLGRTDSIIRILLAAALAALFFGKLVTGTWGIILLVVAVVLLLTSVAGFCPLYRLFGFNTSPKTSPKEQ